MNTNIVGLPVAQDDLLGKVVGTEDAPQLEVYSVGPVAPGNFGHYLEVGKTYTLKRMHEFKDMIVYIVPEAEMLKFGCSSVVFAVYPQAEGDPHISMEIDS